MNVFKKREYWWNFIAMLLCVALSVFFLIKIHNSHIEKMTSIKIEIDTLLTNLINGNISSDFVAFRIESRIKEEMLQELKQKNAEDIKYLNMEINNVVNTTIARNKDERVDDLYKMVSSYIWEAKPFLYNKRIVIIWIFAAGVYLLFAFLLYSKKSVLDDVAVIQKNESVLNVIDFGFYFAIIQLSGGILYREYCLLWATLSVPIFFTIIEVKKISKNIENRFNNGWRDAVIHKDALSVCRCYYPIVLYAIVFLSGLVLATMHHKNYDYYWKELFVRLCVAFTTLLVISLIYSKNRIGNKINEKINEVVNKKIDNLIINRNSK